MVGAGVAGLAAIAQAKAMGAVVRAYDVRPVVREQIESLGAEFLQVEYEEDGSGAGGYAKEMSDGWKEVRRQDGFRGCERGSDVGLVLIEGRRSGSSLLVYDFCSSFLFFVDFWSRTEREREDRGCRES